MANAKNALIIGASRGLGLGLVQRLQEDGWNITATVRNPQQPGALADVSGVRIEQLEMNDTIPADFDVAAEPGDSIRQGEDDEGGAGWAPAFAG